MGSFWQLSSSLASSAAPVSWKEMSMIWNADGKHQKLQRTYLVFEGLVDLLGVSSLSISGGNDEWQKFFKDLWEHGYDAEALLENISMLLSSYYARSNTSNQKKLLRKMVLCSPTELRLPRKIVEMQKKLDELTATSNTWVTRDERNVAHYNIISRRSSAINVVGRNKDKDCIVNLLHNNDGTTPTTNFSVISIVGMAGIGKTTVARRAYDDASNFDKKIWVTVPADFDTIKITKSIIEFDTASPCNLSEIETLQGRLRQILRNFKFLIVLDNFWDEKYRDCDFLYWPFQVGAQGSKVIVTTRNMRVSRIVLSDEVYVLEKLSEDDCWEIIKQRAKMRVEPSPNLKSIGMNIAKKCEGVPYVATILGNMLSCKSTDVEWFLVMERELWLQGNNILDPLIQSYLELPTHSRKCFAYCSIFPQGYEFEKEELVNLWIAEGYVRSTRPGIQYLTTTCFEDLHSRFFFYECRRGSNLKQIRYKMPDLIHGMAQLVFKDLCFHTKHGESNYNPLFGNACHLSLDHDGIQPLDLKASVKNERLRTFLVINSSSNANATKKSELDHQLFSYLKFLRVLGLGGAGLEELVDSIAQLQYLRYLNMSNNPISHLPKSVCTIVALEILKLRNCTKLRDLPEEMSSLINLRHLEFDERVIAVMPPHFRNLVKLEYLSAYTVGKKNGCGIGELQSLNCLFKSLYIGKIEISNTSEAQEARLDLKRYLHKLELEWTRPGERITEEVRQQMLEQNGVLTALQPHINLEELVLTNYLGTTFPSWLSDPSHNLKSIDLNGVKHCDHLPDLGELPCLKFFSISYMPHLGSIGCQFYGSKKFPSLEFFQLRGLLVLENWAEANEDDNVKVMPHLHNFKLEYCPILPRLPRRVQECRRPDTIVTHCPGLQP